jgi:hypothetical protein
MQVQATNRLRRIIRKVDYFATLLYLYYLYFQDGFLGVARHFVMAVWRRFRSVWNMILLEFIKRPVHNLMFF